MDDAAREEQIVAFLRSGARGLEQLERLVPAGPRRSAKREHREMARLPRRVLVELRLRGERGREFREHGLAPAAHRVDRIVFAVVVVGLAGVDDQIDERVRRRADASPLRRSALSRGSEARRESVRSTIAPPSACNSG